MNPRNHAGPTLDRFPRRWVAALVFLCALSILWQARRERFSMNADGMSYLDMAHRLVQGDFSTLIHPYWSPLYPALLALVFKVIPPTLENEFPLVHLVNCLIAWGGLASFTFFLTQWLRLRASSSPARSALEGRFCAALGYALFLWSTLETAGVGTVSPDLSVNALVFLAAGLSCRMTLRARSAVTAVELGLVLSLAYLAKTALLPIGVVLLVLLALAGGPALRRRDVAIAGVTLVLGAGTYVALLSTQAHKLTLGESGRINYAWWVDRGVPKVVGWTGDTPGYGTPVHPPHLLSASPRVLEFKDSVPGTYPPWYDPSFFYEGVRVRFEPRRQIEAVVEGLQRVRYAHGRSLIPLLAGLVVLGLFGARGRRLLVWKHSWTIWPWTIWPWTIWLILWPLAAMSAYTLVLVQTRYLSVFLVLLWLGLYELFSPRKMFAVQRAIFAVTALAVVGFTFTDILANQPASDTAVAISRALLRSGLASGAQIAVVGQGMEAYYAHLAGYQVIAEIDEAPAYWKMSAQDADALDQKLRHLGAQAIVSPDMCPAEGRSGWHSLEQTGYCVLVFP